MCAANSVLVSVVVPVYNAQDHLSGVLDALRAQEHDNLEIILVDDGSSDASPRMCDGAAEQDDRIRVLHVESGGPAAARNRGVEAATGEYVCFVDSDDRVSADHVARLVTAAAAADVDMLMFGYREIDAEGRVLACYPCETVARLPFEAFVDGLFREEVAPSVWSKFFKRSLFDKVRFREGCMVGEELLLYANIVKAGGCTCASLDYVGYDYLRNESSLMRTFSEKHEWHAVRAWDELGACVAEVYPNLAHAALYASARVRFSFLDRLVLQGEVKTDSFTMLREWFREHADVCSSSLVTKRRRMLLKLLAVCPAVYCAAVRALKARGETS